MLGKVLTFVQGNGTYVQKYYRLGVFGFTLMTVGIFMIAPPLVSASNTLLVLLGVAAVMITTFYIIEIVIRVMELEISRLKEYAREMESDEADKDDIIDLRAEDISGSSENNKKIEKDNK